MPDLEDLGNAMVKDMLQSTRGGFWFPWRPGMSLVKLGSYCSCNGLTCTYEGDIDRFGCTITSAPAAPGLTVSEISSNDYSIVFAGVDQQGNAKTTTDIGELDLNAKTTATYAYASELQYNVILSDTAISALGEPDAAAYLANEVWPRLHSDPSWQNSSWVVCGNVATARSYVLAGAVAAQAEFSITMDRGFAIEDLVAGKITSDFDMVCSERMDLHDSAFRQTELVVGYTLYHFDDDGNPRVYTPWY